MSLLEATGQNVASEAVFWADVELKYSGYLAKEQAAATKFRQMADLEIPADLEYKGVAWLSIEAREKLSSVRPRSLAQASRIPGISPSDLQGLMIAVLKHRNRVSRETEASPS